MKLLIPTDAFPPVCGGSGWSTYELASGLRARGHDVLVVRPVPGAAENVREAEYDGFRVIEFGSAAPNVPYVRNYFKNERLHSRLETYLIDLIRQDQVDLVHAQHVLTCIPSVRAARRSGIPSICTVRDYWPVCYWSNLLHTADQAALCPECSARGMTQCIRPRAGGMWPLAVPLIPYMRGNLARKRAGLAAADAIVPVSSTIAADLRARAPELSGTRMVTIPNPVNIADLCRRVSKSSSPIGSPYALYLGKLAPNKGTTHLIPAIEQARLDWPLVVAGDGPERSAIESAAARSSHDVRFVGWVGRDETAVLLAHASMLIFPSRGPESLSRVLIEASALGVPIAAMNTGGTPDIVVHEETGLLSVNADELAGAVRRLRDDPALRARLGDAARQRARALFDAPAVVGRIESLYREVLERAA
jgi:glycosyltransferase involved in cell wall biosynthesis